MESRTTCSMVLHGKPYHMQHGTAWRAVPHAAWYCMESHTTCSMVVNGEPSHIQHGTPWSVSISACRLPTACCTTLLVCGTALHVVWLSMQSQAAGGTALHAVPCCRWYGSACSTMLQVVQLSMQSQAAGGTAPCSPRLQVVRLSDQKEYTCRQPSVEGSIQLYTSKMVFFHSSSLVVHNTSK